MNQTDGNILADVEEWRTVPGWENYEVSTYGGVRNKTTGHIFSKPKQANNYHRVILSREGGKKTVGVHRLVASAFLGEKTSVWIPNHKDGVKSNNYLSNLEWCVPVENVAHARDTGLMRPRRHPWRRAAEATRKIVQDVPASVKDQLAALAAQRGETVKALLLRALEETYGIHPTGE